MRRTHTLKDGTQVEQWVIYVLDHDAYGEQGEYDTLEDAQSAMRYGDTYPDIVLRVVCGRVIRDQHDNAVGHVEYR